MLQTEKKKTGNRSKLFLLCVFAVLAAACIAGGFILSGEKDHVPVRESTGGTLVTRDAGEIRRIRVQARDRAAWTAERRADGKLYMLQDGSKETADLGWVLDATLADRIEDALAHLGYEDILAEQRTEYADRLAEFGLDSPALTAEVTFSDGEQKIIKIGNASGLEDWAFRFMVVEGDPRLYAVSENVMEDLDVEVQLLHPVIQPEIQVSRLDRITVRDGEGKAVAEWALDGRITDADAAENWQVRIPFTYPADQDQMQNMRKNAGNFRLGLYIAEADEQNLAAYGLDKPCAEIEFHMSAGSTGEITDGGTYEVREHEEEILHFYIGDPRNEMTDYCRFENTIYTINHFTVAAIAETDPRETLARYPVTASFESLSSLEIIRASGRKDLYVLNHRTDPSEYTEAPEKPETICLKNGQEIDCSVFEAAYNRMRVVSFSGEIPDGWKRKETHTTYLFRTINGKTHRIELSEFDAMHDAVTVDGQTMFYLIHDGMGEMP